jgi:hypothetical protein
MNVMTDNEVRELVQENSWSTGIRVDANGDLFYDSPDANCIAMSFPETPLRVTYVARLISMMATEGDEALFYGALLWIRLWNIGSPQLEKSGWRLVERMRMGFGELRPLGVANGHWFRSDEVADLAAFIVPCLVYGWDAYIVPASAGSFTFISHDEFWCVATRDSEVHSRVSEELKDLKPLIVETVRQRFCRQDALPQK